MTKKKAGLIGFILCFIMGILIGIDENNQYKAGYADGLKAGEDDDESVEDPFTI